MKGTDISNVSISLGLHAWAFFSGSHAVHSAVLHEVSSSFPSKVRYIHCTVLPPTLKLTSQARHRPSQLVPTSTDFVEQPKRPVMFSERPNQRFVQAVYHSIIPGKPVEVAQASIEGGAYQTLSGAAVGSESRAQHAPAAPPTSPSARRISYTASTRLPDPRRHCSARRWDCRSNCAVTGQPTHLIDRRAAARRRE